MTNKIRQEEWNSTKKRAAKGNKVTLERTLLRHFGLKYFSFYCSFASAKVNIFTSLSICSIPFNVASENCNLTNISPGIRNVFKVARQFWQPEISLLSTCLCINEDCHRSWTNDCHTRNEFSQQIVPQGFSNITLSFWRKDFV